MKKRHHGRALSEPKYPGDLPRGEHYRAYWQEELDHAYRVAAQAFGL